MVIKFSKIKDDQSEDKPRAETIIIPAAALVIAAGLRVLLLVVLLGSALYVCGILLQIIYSNPKTDPDKPSITRENFGTYEGNTVYRYTLRNKNGMEVKILNYGGIITNIYAHDKHNNLEDVVLGFDTFEGYKNNTPYFGALIGRYANRIAGGHFTLDGVTYNLTKNDGPNALHGGLKGFDKRFWNATIADSKLILSYISADGEEHYPGQVYVTVTYELTDRNELIITYRAQTSKPTIINLTNHAYFNLAGQSTNTIADHVVRLDADYYLPVDITQIPIGILAEVKGTKFDLKNYTRLGDRIPEVPGGIGFDHNFCLQQPGWMKHAARVVHPLSGRALDMYTTEPGVQFYTSYNLGGQPGKGGIIYNRYGAFALEAQHYPDSPNQPTFPTTVLRPEQEYRQDTIYQFSTAT